MEEVSRLKLGFGECLERARLMRDGNAYFRRLRLWVLSAGEGSGCDRCVFGREIRDEVPVPRSSGLLVRTA